MSMKTIMRGALVACCAALGLHAWAADIQITNVGTIVHPSGGTIGTNQGQYPVAGLRISADDTLGIANGEILKIKKIAIAYNTSGTNTATHHLQLNGVNSAEKTTDATMAIGNESVATYVFESDVYAVVGATMPMLALNESGASTLFRCRVYDHQSSEQHFQRSAIVTTSHYAGTNWGAMYRIVAEKVPSYAKGTLNAYLNKNTAQTLIPGATLADISKGWIVGKVNGGYVSTSFKETLIYPFNVTEVKDPDTQELTAINMQFQLQEGRNLVKAVLAECTETAEGVVIKATGAKVNQTNDSYGEDASNWTNADLATSAGGNGYGIHDLSFLVFSTSITVTESKTWAEVGASPITGETVTVLVDPAATITFAEGDSVAGFQFMSTSENGGVSVSGVIPSDIVIVGKEILSGTASISNFASSKVTVTGTATLTADITVTGSELTLDNGAITSTSDKAIKFDADTVVISASGTSSISKLWGTGHTATINVAEDGELTIAKIVNNYANTIVKDGAGVMKVTNNASNKQVSYQLKAGTIVGKAGETSITKHSSVSGLVVLASEPEEGFTTYTLGMKPRTEAATITMKDWTGPAFTYVDGEETLDTTLMEGDKIVIPSTIADDNYWQWHFTDGADAFAGHEVEINKNMNWKWSVGTMTIGSGATAHLFNTYGLIDGASVSGEGTLSLNDNGANTPVNGAATISCTVAFVGNGSFKLSTAASTLTCAKLEEGEEITKVVSGVDGKHVEYSDGKYVLVDDAPDAPTATVTDLADAPEGVEGAHTFTAVEPTEAQAAYYGDWNADFIVTFSRDMVAGEVTLTGHSDHHSTEWVDLDVGAVAAETGIPLIARVLEQTGYPEVQVTYDFVCNTVGTFNCGVKNNLAVGAENATMTVQLVLSKGSKTIPIGDAITYTLKAPTRPSDVESGSQAQKDAFDAWVEKHSVTDPSTANVNAFILDMPNESTDAELKTKLASLITPEMVQKLAADGATTETTVTIPGYGNAVFKFVPATLGEGVTTSAKLFRLTATFVPANSQK